MSIISSLSIAGLGAVGFIALRRALGRTYPAPLPPGPRGLPIVGNIFDWPKEEAWIKFTEWSREFGELVYANLAGQHVVVINDYNLNHELLDRKGSIYSDRPYMHMACDLVGWKGALPLMPYGAKMRDYRGQIARTIGTKSALLPYSSMLDVEVRLLVRDLVGKPDVSLAAHARKMVGAVIMNITFGYPIKDGEDPMIRLATQIVSDFDDISTPGRYAVDTIPAIDYLPEWFPGLQYRSIVTRMKKTLGEFMDGPYQYVEKQLEAGTAPPSFVASQIDDRTDVIPEQQERVKWIATALWGGGNDTTLSAVHTFFLAMTLYPLVQQQAQAEIDKVLGSGIIPTLSDWPRLPYVEAVFLEVLRWGQVSPVGIPHVSQADDIHCGYFIPKGTLVISNIWQFGHDPEQYEDPATFNPERFLDSDVRIRDPRDYVFGFGRRVCPGQQLAEQTLWLTCAVSLAALSVSQCVNEDNVPIIPEVRFRGHLITQPKEFPCIIKSRQPAHDRNDDT